MTGASNDIPAFPVSEPKTEADCFGFALFIKMKTHGIIP